MKRIRRRTRNKLIAVASTLAVLALGVFIVTSVNMAGNNSEFDKFVGDAKEFGIVAQDSIEETYVDSESNFATRVYKGTNAGAQYTGNNVGDARANAPGKIIVGDVEGNFNLHTGATVVSVAENEKKILNEFNVGHQVKFEAETKESIEAQIDAYIAHTKQYAESVVNKESEGAVLGFYYEPVGERPEAPEVVAEPVMPTEPTQPEKKDEYENASGATTGEAAGADFQALVKAYFEEWAAYDKAYKQYKEDVKKYKSDLKEYEEYLEKLNKYNKKLKYWEDANKYQINQETLMKKHRIGLLGDGSTGEINKGNDLRTFVLVDVLDVNDDVAYVDMDPFFDSNIDDFLCNYRENGIPIYVYKRPGQTIVFNSSDSSVSDFGKNEKFLPPFYVVDTDGMTYLGGNGYGKPDETAKSIIWNFTSTDMILVKSNVIHSTIIAPNSDVRLGCEKVSGNGWIICKSMWSASEWHMVGKEIPTGTPTPKPTEEPVVTETPAEETEVPGAETETPVVTETPVETETPVVTETPVETETPVVTEKPVVTETPVETETPVVTETPVETETPVVTETPVETEKPVVTPAPETTPEGVVTPAPTSTPEVVIPPAPTSTPSIVVPPSSTSTPAPEVTNAPTETPLTVVDEDVPLGPASPEEEVTEVPEEDVPLSNFNAPTKPKKDTTTVIEEDVPLAATVPETGDSMNPMVPLAGMGLSLIAIAGVVVIRKKKLIK
ncbi:MAG: LPXTG cell wall anchor domain-containing protein [Eubacterium sp.]|nr:LPXTG cell wall anchor domain-containing protein [Eubacterium sp.]